MHGTLPWTAENERRTLLYKFTPGHVSYASIYYNHDDYEDLTEQQKRVLTPPSVRRPNVGKRHRDSRDGTKESIMPTKQIEPFLEECLVWDFKEADTTPIMCTALL